MSEFHNAHVFVVDVNTFTVHKNFLFCGVVNPNSEGVLYGVYADLMTLREGDLVYFYQRYDNKHKDSNGFHGIYEITGKPFFDSTDIIDLSGKKVFGKCVCGHTRSPKRQDQFSPAKCQNCGRVLDHPILPNRVFIKVKEYFEKSVSDDYAYVDHTDYGVLWTMLFKKTTGAGRARSIMTILPEESQKLKRLLLRANKNQISNLITQTYTGTSTQLIQLDLVNNLSSNGSLKAESVLQAWIMQNIDKNVPILGTIIGPLNELEYFGGFLPYNLGTSNIDVLCLHKKDGKRFKATVIELKKDKINKSAVNQINDYLPWIAQLVTENVEPQINSIDIQPVVIGSGKTRNVTIQAPTTIARKFYSNNLNGSRNQININVKSPILLGYSVNQNNSISLRVL